ncbi:MAG: hypothetical protein M3Q49_03950 [Actinomycetota bacterium]|nr:hypothetical protein [Actinomycetota bacterium]
MHGLHATLARRLEAVARRLGAAPEPETPAETSRRLELCRAALVGEIPEDLRDGERPTFSKMVRDAPLLFELLDEGALDGYLDGDDPHQDGDGDEAPAWRP